MLRWSHDIVIHLSESKALVVVLSTFDQALIIIELQGKGIVLILEIVPALGIVDVLDLAQFPFSLSTSRGHAHGVQFVNFNILDHPHHC